MVTGQVRSSVVRLGQAWSAEVACGQLRPSMVSRGQHYQLKSSFVCRGQAWSAEVKLGGQPRSVVVSSGQPRSVGVSKGPCQIVFVHYGQIRSLQ